MSNQRNVIIGAGMAGVSAAETMRQVGFQGEILMVGEEPEPPYHRPPLSKHFLGPEPMGREELAIHPAGFFREQQVELELASTGLALDIAGRRISLASGRTVTFHQALIATGARPRQIDVPGADLDGVVYLRTIENAAGLVTRLGRSSQIVVVGGGLIGLEIASAARTLGKSVIVLEASPAPLCRVLDARMGAVVAQIHREHGVDLRLGARVAEVVGTESASGVRLQDGTVIPADLVVVAIGVTPNMEWLAGSGLPVHDGVLVNENAETTAPGIFAAGDVARAWNPWLGQAVRMEQVGNARAQGQAAGSAMAGRPVVYGSLPAVGTQQHRQKINVLGLVPDDTRVVIRGSLENRSFIAFYLQADRLVGAVALNRARDLPQLRELVERRVVADPDHFRDLDVPLELFGR